MYQTGQIYGANPFKKRMEGEDGQNSMKSMDLTASQTQNQAQSWMKARTINTNINMKHLFN